MWILFFVLFAPFTPSIDLYVSSLFYSQGLGFYDNFFFHALFKYGEWFGLATGVTAMCLYVLSFFYKKLSKWRQGSLAMLLTLVIGAGLITNICLKGCWGRPRPKQITEFGGKVDYRPFWSPDFRSKDEPQKSFPSGHAAMGCYFLSMCLIGRRYRSKALFLTGLFLTILLGCGLMIGRVVQGGHFVSDVVASSVIMWYIAKGSVWLTWEGSARRSRYAKLFGTFQEPEHV